MGRRCKCRICGKELNTDNAYRVQIISPSGKRNNSYYCNEGEYLFIFSYTYIISYFIKNVN